jgi:hypothetical protein
MLSLEVDALVAIDVRTVAVVDEAAVWPTSCLSQPSTTMWVSSGQLILVYWPIGLIRIVGITKEHADGFALHLGDSRCRRFELFLEPTLTPLTAFTDVGRRAVVVPWSRRPGRLRLL